MESNTERAESSEQQGPATEADAGISSPGTARTGTGPQLSKNQMKKAAKLERLRLKKETRKAREKANKQQLREQRKADMESKLAQMTEEQKAELRAQQQANRAARKQDHQRKVAKMEEAMRTGPRLVIDCDFEDMMNESELRHLAQQLSYSHHANCKAERPCHLHLLGFKGQLAEVARRVVTGIDNWTCTISPATYLEHFSGMRSAAQADAPAPAPMATDAAAEPVPEPAVSQGGEGQQAPSAAASNGEGGTGAGAAADTSGADDPSQPVAPSTSGREASEAAASPAAQTAPASAVASMTADGGQPANGSHARSGGRLVYLSADSTEELDELDDNDVYIIGGLVDHNRYKGLCHKNAVANGVATARLPIQRYVKLDSRAVLTVNQVAEIMIGYFNKRDWQVVLDDVLPLRKRADRKGGDQRGHGSDGPASASDTAAEPAKRQRQEDN